MRDVSGRWNDAIASSHQMAVFATLLDGGEETSLDQVVEGSVSLDARAATRGTCDLVIADDGSLGLIPSGPTDPLAPYGNEIRIERGIIYPDNFLEVVSLGVFRIDDVDVEDAGSSMNIRITGLDRSARLIDARFEDPYQVAAGTNYVDAIEEVLRDGWFEIEFDTASTTLTTPVLIAEVGEDRWQFAQTMATAIGMELFFDGDGICVLRPVAQDVGDAQFDIVEGESGVLVRAARRWTRQGAFNKVIATGENMSEAAPAARGEATDLNENSPTYYFGDFGRVPRFYSSPFITTDAQAAQAAESLLARELGTTQQISFGSIVNPALEPGDVVRVTRERIGLDEDHVIDSLSVPLGSTGTMEGTTRATVVS